MTEAQTLNKVEKGNPSIINGRELASSEIYRMKEKSVMGSENGKKQEEEENSPVEQVAMTVSTQGDPSIPVWTFRMWFLGLIYCITLSVLQDFIISRQRDFLQSKRITQVFYTKRLMAEVRNVTNSFNFNGDGDV